MASIHHLAMHVPIGDVATRYASCKQCSKCSFFSQICFVLNVVLIEVDTFTFFSPFFDTMESMKGHTDKESEENNPKGTDRLLTPQLFLLVFFSLMS